MAAGQTEAPKRVEIVDSNLNPTPQAADMFKDRLGYVAGLIQGLQDRVDRNMAKGLAKLNPFSKKFSAEQAAAIKVNVAQRLNSLAAKLAKQLGSLDFSDTSSVQQFEQAIKDELDQFIVQAIQNPSSIVLPATKAKGIARVFSGAAKDDQIAAMDEEVHGGQQ